MLSCVWILRPCKHFVSHKISNGNKLSPGV